MKTLDLFVVELEKQINDTIKTDSGLELYVDSKWNEFKHRVTEGPVVASPLKHDPGVKEGDTLYFQLWYRDANPGPTSNLSNALHVLLH